MTADQETMAGNARPPRRWRALRALLLLAGIVVATVGGGFLWFVNTLPVAETPPARNADGIVVLTGAALRISDALALLSEGHGRRLLITGVNPSTRSREIASLMPEHRRWFDCCVDLDHSATNTSDEWRTLSARCWPRRVDVRDRGLRPRFRQDPGDVP
jgi:hypothetical protein